MQGTFSDTPQQVSLLEDEPFSLESFLALIHQRFQNGKEMYILARVSEEGGRRCFFYDAFALNKLLFRSYEDKDRSIICRMQAANPLTNMEINGKVQYFTCRTNLPSEAVRALTHRASSSTMTSTSSVNEHERALLKRSLGDSIAQLEVKASNAAGSPLAKALSGNVHVGIQRRKDRPTQSTPDLSREKKEPTRVNAKEWPFTYIGSEDDYLFDETFREAFEAAAISDSMAQLYALPDEVVQNTHTDAFPTGMSGQAGMWQRVLAKGRHYNLGLGDPFTEESILRSLAEQADSREQTVVIAIQRLCALIERLETGSH